MRRHRRKWAEITSAAEVISARLAGCAVAGVVAAATALAAPAADAAAWRPDVSAARAYAAARPGAVGFSIRWGDNVAGYRSGERVIAASTVKTMLLLAYLRRPEVRSRPLTREQRHLLAPMIRWSADAEASRVREIVGLEGMAAVARAAGMRDYEPYTGNIWGHTRTTAHDQALLFWRLERLLPPRHRAFALRLLREIVAPQRWGIAQAAPRGWRLYFKGGWGSGSGAVDHQAALLVRGERRIALAVTTVGNGSHAAGKATLRGVAARLLRGL